MKHLFFVFSLLAAYSNIFAQTPIPFSDLMGKYIAFSINNYSYDMDLACFYDKDFSSMTKREICSYRKKANTHLTIDDIFGHHFYVNDVYMDDGKNGSFIVLKRDDDKPFSLTFPTSKEKEKNINTKRTFSSQYITQGDNNEDKDIIVNVYCLDTVRAYLSQLIDFFEIHRNQQLDIVRKVYFEEKVSSKVGPQYTIHYEYIKNGTISSYSKDLDFNNVEDYVKSARAFLESNNFEYFENAFNKEFNTYGEATYTFAGLTETNDGLSYVFKNGEDTFAIPHTRFNDLVVTIRNKLSLLDLSVKFLLSSFSDKYPDSSYLISPKGRKMTGIDKPNYVIDASYDEIAELLDSFINTKIDTKGKMTFTYESNKEGRAFLGATFQNQNVSNKNNTQILEIVPKSSAEAYGLHIGDIIEKIGTYEIKNYDDIQNALLNYNEGDETTVRISRCGIQNDLKIKFYKGGHAPINEIQNETCKASKKSAYSNSQTSIKQSSKPNLPKFNGYTNVLTMYKALPEEYKRIGLFKVMNNYYEIIYQYHNSYYMMSMFEDTGKYGTAERLVVIGKNRWRFANDTGETFKLTDTALLGYMDGDYACEWKRLF